MTNVTVYSAEWCPWCQRTKHFLKDHNVKFTEKDVDNDHEAAHEMVHKTGQSGIPVIDIDGKMIIGFDEYALRKLLKIKD